MAYERISQREYAKRKGVSNTAVYNAIQDGVIKKGWDRKVKKIIVELADAEWGGGKAAAVKELHNEGDVPLPAAKKAAKTVKEQDHVAVQENEPTEITGDEPLLKLHEKTTTYKEALRLEMVYKAQSQRQKFLQEKGELVRVSDVNKQLFEIGQQWRKTMERWPERVVDMVRACDTRDEALRNMNAELRELLEGFINSAVK